MKWEFFRQHAAAFKPRGGTARRRWPGRAREAVGPGAAESVRAMESVREAVILASAVDASRCSLREFEDALRRVAPMSAPDHGACAIRCWPMSAAATRGSGGRIAARSP